MDCFVIAAAERSTRARHASENPSAATLAFWGSTSATELRRPSFDGPVGRPAVPPRFGARAPRWIPPLTVRLRPRLVTGDAGVLAEARGRWPLVRLRPDSSR